MNGVIKIVLGVGIGFIIGFVTALWWEKQVVELPHSTVNEVASESTAADSEVSATSSLEQSEQNEQKTEPATTSFSITEEQRAMLLRFGINPDTITITQEMVLCAEQALGKARISDIMAGATPSLFESMKLIGCYQQ